MTPNNFGCVFRGDVELFICRCSLVVDFTRSRVNSVQVVLSGLNMRLLSFFHLRICCRYGCKQL